MAATPPAVLEAWGFWFERLEHAAATAERRLTDGHSPQWPFIAPPGATLPPELESRRGDVVRLLTELQHQMEYRREELGVAMAKLAHRPQVPAQSGRVGATFDVCG